MLQAKVGFIFLATTMVISRPRFNGFTRGDWDSNLEPSDYRSCAWEGVVMVVK